MIFILMKKAFEFSVRTYLSFLHQFQGQNNICRVLQSLSKYHQRQLNHCETGIDIFCHRTQKSYYKKYVFSSYRNLSLPTSESSVTKFQFCLRCHFYFLLFALDLSFNHDNLMMVNFLFS